MSWLNFLKQKEVIGGEIAYYNLEEWWIETFSKKERDHIIRIFQPLGSSGDSLIKGKLQYISGSVVSFLSNLAGWFKNETDREIGYRLLKKAESLINLETTTLDKHFFYQNKLEFCYRFRDIDKELLEVAIDSCKKQIEIAPKTALSFREEYKDNNLPAHKGYEQLSIIYEKQGKYNEAIDLCEQAKRQDWSGDWDKRIKRCEKRKIKYNKHRNIIE